MTYYFLISPEICDAYHVSCATGSVFARQCGLQLTHNVLIAHRAVIFCSTCTNEIAEEIKMLQPLFDGLPPALNHLLHIHPQLFEGDANLLPFLVQTKHPIWE
jgi:hypothetical protein